MKRILAVFVLPSFVLQPSTGFAQEGNAVSVSNIPALESSTTHVSDYIVDSLFMPETTTKTPPQTQQQLYLYLDGFLAARNKAAFENAIMPDQPPTEVPTTQADIQHDHDNSTLDSLLNLMEPVDNQAIPESPISTATTSPQIEQPTPTNTPTVPDSVAITEPETTPQATKPTPVTEPVEATAVAEPAPSTPDSETITPAETAALPTSTTSESEDVKPSPPAPEAQLNDSTALYPKVKPVTIQNQPLNNADIAYLELLNKKQQALPQQKKLSDLTKGVMADVTDNFIANRPAPPVTTHVDIEHGSMKQETVTSSGSLAATENTPPRSMNVSVKNHTMVSSGSTVNDTLQLAYKALVAGQISAAIRMYKDVLNEEHDNHDALFGLATAYHRNHQTEQARSIYTELLEIDPNHKEALNNFLVLVSEEAPEDALFELQKLERINPQFSPIPAQIAMIYIKLGKPAQAEQYLKRALKLSPLNIVYVYNAAIISDQLGKTGQAVAFYRKVLDAIEDGATVPGSVQQISDRLAFLEKTSVKN